MAARQSNKGSTDYYDDYDDYDDYGWPAYVPVAERRRRAAQKVAKMRAAGKQVKPVEIDGRSIATTFWGKAWCKNLEAYSDYSNRLPRGRSYVRNGSVVDLKIEAAHVYARVSGTRLYTVDIKIEPLLEEKWTKIKTQCAGQIDSLVELLQGSFSKSVMEIVSRKGEGLFPSPSEISLRCSCPDWATMCKHVAATLYGVGARLDHEPELLFTLRKVDATEMIEAAVEQPTGTDRERKSRVLASDDLSALFGVDIDMTGVFDEQASKGKRGVNARTKRKTKAATKQSAVEKSTQKPAKKAAEKANKNKNRSKKSTVQGVRS